MVYCIQLRLLAKAMFLSFYANYGIAGEVIEFRCSGNSAASWSPALL